MTRFYCPQILLSDGWAENQLLEVDGLGSITGIRNGSMNEAQHQLQGPVVPGMPNLQFPCVPARNGRAVRVAFRGEGFFLELAQKDVPFPPGAFP